MDVAERNTHLARALSYSGETHEVADVLEGVHEGRFQMWTGEHSVMVTEVEQYPKGKVLHFFLAGGTMDELSVMFPFVRQWGKDQGCVKATLTGRKGWARSFLTKHRGWRELDLVLLEGPID